MNKSLLPLTKHNIHVPWLLSNQPARKQAPSFFAALKQRHILNAATQRVQSHLHEPAYMFPEDFYTDVRHVLKDLFSTLNRADITRESLRPFMLRQLVDAYFPDHEDILSRNGRIEYDVSELESCDVKLSDINLTYGPYPVPEGYIAQAWYLPLSLSL